MRIALWVCDHDGASVLRREGGHVSFVLAFHPPAGGGSHECRACASVGCNQCVEHSHVYPFTT